MRNKHVKLISNRIVVQTNTDLLQLPTLYRQCTALHLLAYSCATHYATFALHMLEAPFYNDIIYKVQ